jgi:hypothetical protein
MSLAARREFLLVPEAKMVDVPQNRARRRQPRSSIIGGSAEGGVDVLVVSYKSYPAGDAWLGVVSPRAGLPRVLLVDVDDVYDEFNNGVSARARRAALRAAFSSSTATAAALCSVGDSSEDTQAQCSRTPARISSRPWTRNDNVPSLGMTRSVTTDKRLVKFPGPGGIVDAGAGHDYRATTVRRIRRDGSQCWRRTLRLRGAAAV